MSGIWLLNGHLVQHGGSGKSQQCIASTIHCFVNSHLLVKKRPLVDTFGSLVKVPVSYFKGVWCYSTIVTCEIPTYNVLQLCNFMGINVLPLFWVKELPSTICSLNSQSRQLWKWRYVDPSTTTIRNEIIISIDRPQQRIRYLLVEIQDNCI